MINLFTDWIICNRMISLNKRRWNSSNASEKVWKSNNTINNIKTHNYLIDDGKWDVLNNYKNNFLEKSSKNVLDLKILLDSIYKEYLESNNESILEEGQINLEQMCLNYEKEFFNNLLSSLDVESIQEKGLNFSRIQFNVMVDWESKIVKSLEVYLRGYTVNKYAEFIREFAKNSNNVNLVLLLLAFKNSSKDLKHFISILLSLILRLLSQQGEPVKKVNLVMDLMNLLLLRAPSKLNLEIDNLNLQEYYLNNILEMSEDSKGVIGLTLLDIILNNVDALQEIKGKYESIEKKKYNYIIIKDEYIDVLMRKSISPLILPMIAKPLNWKYESEKCQYVIGGYHTSEMRRLLNTRNQFVKQNYKNTTDSIVGDKQEMSINYLNKQGFRINKNMLPLLLSEFNSENSVIFKGYNKLHPLSESMNKLDIYKDAKWIKTIMSHNSIYLLNKTTLELAILFEKFTFYLPTFMDFRGRIYSFVYFLNYQGSDIARSLIEFADGCSVEADTINVIYQYLANTAGKSKLTIKGKIKWAKTFLHQNFMDITLDNDLIHLENFNSRLRELVGNKIISSTEEIGQLTSILLFLIRHKYNPSLKCHTPILFDATCSGMQHLAALLSDITLALMSNVIGNEDNIPQDVYSEVGKRVSDTIMNLEDDVIRNALSKINITRSLMKKPVMTIPYNVSLRTMTDQLINEGFFSKEPDGLYMGKRYYFNVNPTIVKNNDILKLSPKELQIFSDILYNSVYTVVPSLKSFKTYFNSMMDVLLKLNLPIVWTTPTGMLISLSSRKFDSYTSKSLYTKGNTITISLPTTSLNRRDIKRAFIPNFIHSMDAANIQQLIVRLIDNYNQDIPLYTIHDCFATTPVNMNIVNNEVKLAFIDLYFNQNYMLEMHKNFIQQISSYTSVFNEDIVKDGWLINTQYIMVDEKKILIPNLPPFIMWNEVKDTFIKGIKNSTYFIN